MNKESEIKNLLTQIKEKAMFDDRHNRSKDGKSFMVFHLELLEKLIDEYFRTNRR
jgi:hypothetical protein